MADKDMLKDYAELLTGYLSEQTKMFMFILDRTGGIVWVNAAFRQMIGRQEQIEGLDIRELLAPESRNLLTEPEARITDNLQLLFSDAKPSSHMLTCRVFSFGDHSLVLSEQMMATETAVMQHMSVLNNELSNITRELHRKNVILQQTMDELKILKGLLPICMHCKKIRDEAGYWNQLEAYISSHSDTQFSHSICDDCLKKFYPEQQK
jgi:hypothetical protein